MFIRDQVADFPVEFMCEVLGLSRSGCCALASRTGSGQAADERALSAAHSLASLSQMIWPCVSAFDYDSVRRAIS
jgi:hypothetical protein